VLNFFYKRTIPRHGSVRKGKKVSVLIPARNEEDNIAECIESLLNQSYQDYEIVIYDDGSTDATWEILTRYQEQDGRIRCIHGADKPDGWKGKTYALHQLAVAAQGDYLYMTDADTFHAPDAISWAVERMEERDLDAFSAMPEQVTQTFAEKLIVPTVFIPLLFLPLQIFNSMSLKRISFGIGQFFMFRREVFFSLGGMSPVRTRVTEDIALARKIKADGYRYQFLNSFGHIRCRMYGSFKESIEGFSKNFYEFTAISPFLVSFAVVVLTLLFVAPPFVALTSLIISFFAPMIVTNILLLLPVAVFFIAWGLNLHNNGFPTWTALLYPAFVVTFIIQAVISLNRYLTGRRPAWKSRTVKLDENSS
jgi:chlorobactene glucosyltransferase